MYAFHSRVAQRRCLGVTEPIRECFSCNAENFVHDVPLGKASPIPAHGAGSLFKRTVKTREWEKTDGLNSSKSTAANNKDSFPVFRGELYLRMRAKQTTGEVRDAGIPERHFRYRTIVYLAAVLWPSEIWWLAESATSSETARRHSTPSSSMVSAE
jgi:hypothetical protein